MISVVLLFSAPGIRCRERETCSLYSVSVLAIFAQSKHDSDMIARIIFIFSLIAMAKENKVIPRLRNCGINHILITVIAPEFGFGFRSVKTRLKVDISLADLIQHQLNKEVKT